MARCTKERAAKITLWITVPILIFSVVMIFSFNTIYNHELKKEINLAEGSVVSKIWEDIPLPIYEKLYFMNITNEEFFLKGIEPLNVTEVGPYTYASRWVKEKPQWNPNNTVSYREVRTYRFVPEMSNGTENDLIYTLNGPMVIASNIARNIKNSVERDTVSAALSAFFNLYGETLIIKKSITELVYDGYDDIIIKEAPYVKKDMPYKNGKFSWLYGKNATDDGLFTVFTGVDDASKTNVINNWKSEESLKFWKGDGSNKTSTCNMLNGTSIETGPPINDNQRTYTFFQSIFCRSLTFNYTEDVTHYGILSKRFKPTSELFANSTENADNGCFEVNTEHPSGILDLSPCQFGAPVFVSFPHFYLADPSYLTSINEMKPNDEKHGSNIDVELITGLSISLFIRFQLNLQVIKAPFIFQFHDARDGIYPIFWVELSLKIDENLADFLKTKLRTPKVIAYSVLAILGGISLSLIMTAAIFLTFCSKKYDDDLLIETNDKESLYANSYGNVNPSACVANEESQIKTVSKEDKTTIQPPNVDENAMSLKNVSNGSAEIL